MLATKKTKPYWSVYMKDFNFYIYSVSFLILMIFSVTSSNANTHPTNVYECTGNCHTVIVQHTHGFSWTIDCGDGTGGYGYVGGAIYNGNCPEVNPY